MHELLGQVSDTAGCQPLGQGTHYSGRSVHEQPEPGVEPSPLMRWTSDGSMMEELLKTFTCAPFDIRLIQLAKIASLIMSLLMSRWSKSICTTLFK